MKNQRLERRQLLTATAATALAFCAPVRAGASASKPIRIIVPFSAGANSDVLTRAIAQQVTAAGGPLFIVENRPGAGGALAAMAVRQAPADGYTLLLANVGTHAILPAVQRVAYDSIRDFQAVTQLFHFPNILAVPERSPARTLDELKALSSRSAGGLTLGSQGVGSPGHLLGAMLHRSAGVRFVHVPYPGGGGPMNVDVVAGRLDMAFSTYASLGRHHDTGKVRFLAVASETRSALSPATPTMRDAGHAGVELDTWFGLVARRETPRPILVDLSAAFMGAARSPRLLSTFATQGVTLYVHGPAAFSELMATDAARLAMVVRDSGIQP